MKNLKKWEYYSNWSTDCRKYYGSRYRGNRCEFCCTKSVEEQGITVVGVPAKNSNVDSKDYI